MAVFSFSAAVFAALSELAPEDAVITVDVGNHAYSFGRYFECKAQSVLMSGYLGSIGFGYPAAMGAWCADRGKRKVIAVTNRPTPLMNLAFFVDRLC